jgi:hypothetical protein
MARGESGIPGSDGPRRPHHSTVVAWLALFIALGGVAAGLPGNNSVGSKDIRGGAVRGSEIHRNAVRSSKLKAGAVTEDAIAAGAIDTGQLLDGAVTPAKIGGVPAARVDTPAQAPGCAAQVIEDGQAEIVQFSSEEFDLEAVHADPPVDCAPSTQSQLLAPVGGIYAVSAQVAWPSNAAGDRTLQVIKTNIGGPVAIAEDNRPAFVGGGTQQNLSTLVALDSGDRVEVQVAQDSGSDLTLANQLSTYFAVTWIAPPPP